MMLRNETILSNFALYIAIRFNFTFWYIWLTLPPFCVLLCWTYRKHLIENCMQVNSYVLRAWVMIQNKLHGKSIQPNITKIAMKCPTWWKYISMHKICLFSGINVIFLCPIITNNWNWVSVFVRHQTGAAKHSERDYSCEYFSFQISF